MWRATSDGIIRHVKCAGIAAAGRSECAYCRQVPHTGVLLRARDRGRLAQPPVGTNHPWYTHRQLKSAVDDSRHRIAHLKLENLALQRSVGRLRLRARHHHQLLAAMAASDFPALHRLIAVALRCGASPQALHARVVAAAQESYRVKSFSSRDLDIMLLVLRLGGRAAAHALSQALLLPSVNTIKRLWTTPVFEVAYVPSAIPNTLRDNGRVLLADGVRSTPQTLVIDEVATSPELQWDPRHDSIGGHCGCLTGPEEHISLGSFDVFAPINGLLDGGSVHRARQLKVIGLASLGGKASPLRPLLAVGDCGRSTWESERDILAQVLDFTASDDVAARGPVWLMGTDGDSRRRRAAWALTIYEAPTDVLD